MTMTPSTSSRTPPTTVAGLSMSIELGMPGPLAADRWSARAGVLAEWLGSEWQREQAGVAGAESSPAHLDPPACPATPRQDDNRETAPR